MIMSKIAFDFQNTERPISVCPHLINKESKYGVIQFSALRAACVCVTFPGIIFSISDDIDDETMTVVVTTKWLFYHVPPPWSRLDVTKKY